MLVLGIETTCDETACAIVKDGKEIIANCIGSQERVHAPFGGVVPELACRSHLDILFPLLEQTLKKGNLALKEIDLIAVSYTPGLVGALLIGLNAAKGLALSLKKPFIGVNHLEAHLYATQMDSIILWPALGVVLSGGHTALLYMEKAGSYQLIGQTQDDAIGEAFDKVAKLLGFSYPGGPHIEQAAQKGDPHRFAFKPGILKGRPFDFSYSGLKTAVFYLLNGQDASKNAKCTISEQMKYDVAASFQHTAFSSLVEKIANAAKKYSCKSIVFGGGVTQNNYLRTLQKQKTDLELFWPPAGLCLDNAAMIAGLGYQIYLQKGGDSLALEAMPQVSF